MKHISALLLGLLLLLATPALAQNQFSKWYFGMGAALDFSSGSPVALSGSMVYTNEGSASMSDSLGNLLFYTDGVTIWDSTNTQMANGFGLSGDLTTTQSALIVQQPGHDSLYYVFTVPSDAAGLTDLRYSVVNMKQNGGLGDVTLKNLFMARGDTIAEKATAIRHCNGKDWWVIFHAIGNDHYLAWKLDSLGLSPNPVVSATGTVITTAQNQGLGWMCSSNDAEWLVAPCYSGGTVDLVQFDNNTGMASNAMILSGFTRAYGTAFSPNDQVLYVTDEMSLAQFDLSSGVAATIQSSRQNIITEANMMRAIRLAPDGKIYVSREWEGHLGVVQFPNTLGFGCTYSSMGVNLAPGGNSLGLPNTYSFVVANPCDPPIAAEDADVVKGLALVNAYPQPFSAVVRMDVHVDAASTVAVAVMDLNGRTLREVILELHAGVNAVHLNLEELAAGMYVVQLQDTESRVTARIVKQ